MNFIVFASVIAAILIRLSLAQLGIHGRIFFGQNAEEYQFKHVALLVPKRTKFFGLVSKVFLCGGTIIGPNWILTAAHCVEGIKKVDVYLGVVNINNIAVSYEVKKQHISIHPAWDNKKILNDIALIQIPKTKPCDKIRYVSLPFNLINSPQTIFFHKEVFVVGWGQTGDHKPMSNSLQWTEMQIIKNVQCNEYYGDITDNDLCANTTRPYGAPCMGDSGGPVILGDTRQLIGIFSSSPKHGCESGIPCFLMRVPSYLPWISAVSGITK